MDYSGIKVMSIMKDLLGNSGPVFLKKEMNELNFSTIDGLNDSQKEELLENLINGVFEVYSPNKRAVLRTRLRSAMNFSKDMIKHFDRKSELSYLLS